MVSVKKWVNGAAQKEQPEILGPVDSVCVSTFNQATAPGGANHPSSCTLRCMHVKERLPAAQDY